MWRQQPLNPFYTQSSVPVIGFPSIRQVRQKENIQTRRKIYVGSSLFSDKEVTNDMKGIFLVNVTKLAHRTDINVPLVKYAR